VDDVDMVWVVGMTHEMTTWDKGFVALWTMYPCFSVEPRE